MKNSEFLGKPVDMNKAEKAGFEPIDFYDFGPDPELRYAVGKEFKEMLEDGEKDYIYYWLDIYIKGDRIAGITRVKEDGFDSGAETRPRQFKPEMEKKVERVLKRIVIKEKDAIPKKLDWMGDIFDACAKTIAAARSGKSLLFASGPFIFVSCKDEKCWDAWMLYPIKGRVMCLLSDRGGWPTDAQAGIDGLTLKWDGTYSIYGIGDEETGKCEIGPVIRYVGDRRYYMPTRKSFMKKFMDLQDEIFEQYLRPQKKSAKKRK